MKYITTHEIVESYASAMNLRLFHKLLFFLASLSVAVWFLCPVFFGQKLPAPILIIVSTVVIVWVLSTLPRYCLLIFKDKRFGKLFFDPFLALRCSLAALKPSRAEANKYPWITMMYYFSIIAPIVCFIISIAYLIGKRELHSA